MLRAGAHRLHSGRTHGTGRAARCLPWHTQKRRPVFTRGASGQPMQRTPRFTHEVVTLWHGHVLEVTRLPQDLSSRSAASVLMRVSGGRLRFAPGVQVQGRAASLAHSHDLPLTPDTSVTASLFPLEVRVRPCAPEQAANALPTRDLLWWNTLIMVAGVCSLTLQVARSAPLEPGEDAPARWVPQPRVLAALKPPPRPAPRVRPVRRSMSPVVTSAADTVRRAPAQAQNVRRRDALNAGVLPLLSQLRGGGGAMARVLSGAVDTELQTALGQLQGNATSVAMGASGLGVRGTGPGGGPGGGVVGLGQLGRGPDGPGGTGVDLNGRPRRATRLPPGEPVLDDGNQGLTRDEIARVMRHVMGQYRYCFERALAADPNVAGKVVLAFSIGPDGLVRVANVAESTLDHSDVEACTVKVTARLRFPAPRGGGQVMVSYPLVFSSAG